MPQLITILLHIYIFFLIAVNSQSHYQRHQLFRNEGGQYYLTLFIGNPPQPQSIIIDNTQKILLLNCKGCLSCKQNQRQQPYRSQQSFSSKIIQCKDQLSICNKECKNKKGNQPCQANIQDYFGKYILKMISDEIRFESDQKDSSLKVNFGCIQTDISQNVHFQNGILGLANSQFNIFTKLLQADDKKPFKQLGFCFSENSGYFQIGQIPKPNNQQMMNFSMHPSNYYSISQANIIKYGNLSLKLDLYVKNTGILILTRQPFTILPNIPYGSVIKEIKSICQAGLCNFTYNYHKKYQRNLTCLVFGQEDIQLNSLFPNFQLQFENQIISWQPAQYMKQYSSNSTQFTGSYCLQFTNSSKLKKYALGLSFLQNKRIIFDILSNSIYLQQKYDCTQKNIQKQVPVQYIMFIVMFIFLFCRNLVVRVINRCKRYFKNNNKVQQIEDKSTASIK